MKAHSKSASFLASAKTRLGLASIAGVLLSLSACGGSGGSASNATNPGTTFKASPKTLQSGLNRNTQPAATNAEVLALAKGQNQFALQSLRLLSAGNNSNLIFSPYSLNYALAMTAAGASGDTLQGIAKALSYPFAQDKMMPALNKLDLLLTAKTNTANTPSFNTANALWAQQGYSVLPAYLDKLAINYGAPMQTLDFISQSEPARQAMNEWVEQQTKGRIKDLFVPGSITSDTRLVLSNAVWFKASWAEQFEKSATSSQNFRLLNGSSVSTPFMQAQLSLPYLKTSNYQAVELPYQQGQLSMLVIQPASGQWQSVLNEFDADKLAQLSQDLQKGGSRKVALSMPKFSYSATTQIKPVLQKLGMTQAFAPGQADFSGITGSKALVINDILHKAFIQVDETGSEAAAATGVVIGVTSIQEPPPVIKLDQAFIYMIRDRETGAILFIGTLLDPQAK